MKKSISVPHFVALALAAAALPLAAVTEDGMFPFVISYDAPDNVVNMSHLLEAPAGKDGRIRVRDGHFVNDRGRVRLHATNLTGPANFPTHAEADRLAARLARFGVNCVRLHYFDSSYGNFMLPKEKGIIDESGGTRRKFNPAQRDRQDYLVAQFKKRGIYVNVNLHVARTLGEADGVPRGSGKMNKGANLFYPRLIELQKEYAKELLSHVNPYTGMSYIEDPVVAVVELNNEESLWRAHKKGELNSRNDVYGKCLRRLWSDWLARRYGTTEKMREAWRLAEKPLPYLDRFRIENGDYPLVHSKRTSAPVEMRRDFCRFLTDVEHGYWTGMRDYLKKDLGLEAPVAGTQLGYSPPHVQADLDYVDKHAYWCHPSVNSNWTIRNKAMVNARGGCILRLAGERVAGKPYTVSEYNHPYPIFYGAEGQPMLRAYGALQGWDGVFEYSYNNRQRAEPDFNEYFFSIVARTDVLAHFPACAAIYLRGDVKESPANVTANLPYADYFEHLVKQRSVPMGLDAASGGRLPAELALVRQVAVDVTGKTEAAKEKAPALGKTITSDTGELTWNCEIPGAGAWTVNTPNTKLFTGFPKGRAFDLGGVKIAVGETKLGWATVSLTSHDATGFGENGRPARILLAATGLCHNKGAKFYNHADGAISCRGRNWGGGPVVAEGVPAAITLPAPAAQVTCRALDARGEPKADVPVAADADGHAVVRIGPAYRTVWYEVAVKAK